MFFVRLFFVLVLICFRFCVLIFFYFFVFVLVLFAGSRIAFAGGIFEDATTTRWANVDLVLF